MEEIIEILDYLKSSRLDIKIEALKALAVSITPDNVHIVTTPEVIFEFIQSISNEETRMHSCALLVNILAENSNCPLQDEMLNILIPLLKHIVETNETDIYLSLVNNLTISEVLCEHFMSLRDAEYFIQNILKGIDGNSSSHHFLQPDPWQHALSIICNISRIENGRKILFKESSNNIVKILQQLESPNPIRRRGAVAAVRTLLFDESTHWWFVNETSGLSALLSLLVTKLQFTSEEKDNMDSAVISAEIEGKPFEPEAGIRLMIIECLILLCQRRIIRNDLRRRKVYPIVRNLDYEQENEDVSTQILELVNLLMRDEEGEEIDHFKPKSSIKVTEKDKPDEFSNSHNSTNEDSIFDVLDSVD